MNVIDDVLTKRKQIDYFLSLMTGDEKHEPSSTSTLDVIWVLFEKVINLTPENVKSERRDRFFLSKGHGPMAFYSILALKGFIAPEILKTYGDYDSILGYHPDRTKMDCVEISSGSLGHGLPMALGSIYGLRAKGMTGPVHWVLAGDAELDEGSNFEAIAFAGRNSVSELNLIVIDNDSASLGWPGGIGHRFSIEGWEVSHVDGRDHAALYEAFKKAHPCKPHVIVASVETKSGKPRRNF